MVKYINIQLVLMCFVVLIVGCNYQIVPIAPVVPEPESVATVCPVTQARFVGDYETLEMRKIWAYCFQSTAAKNPFFPQPVIGGMCDCYVDHLRENHKQSDLAKLSKEENERMAKLLILKCNPKPKPGSNVKTKWM